MHHVDLTRAYDHNLLQMEFKVSSLWSKRNVSVLLLLHFCFGHIHICDLV